MKLPLLLLICAIAVVSSMNRHKKYCKIKTCPPGQHTMCVYGETDSFSMCGTKVGTKLTKEEEQLAILDAHNEYRNRLYTGREIRGEPGPQPPATEISLLDWDDELAEIAQMWSDQCIIKHDECRNTAKYYVGQNFIRGDYVVGMTKKMELSLLRWLVGHWYDEVRRFDSSTIDKFDEATTAASRALNFTQLIWERSAKIGCGVTRYTNDEAGLFLVCNYAPKGNVPGQPIYITG